MTVCRAGEIRSRLARARAPGRARPGVIRAVFVLLWLSYGVLRQGFDRVSEGGVKERRDWLRSGENYGSRYRTDMDRAFIRLPSGRRAEALI